MTDTEPCHPIDPAHQFPRDIYLMVVDLLRRALPDPAEDTPEAWALRHRVAMGEVAALLPAGGAEAHVAANHVVANWAASECMCAAAAQKDNPKRADQLQNQSAKLGREARGYTTRCCACRRSGCGGKRRKRVRCGPTGTRQACWG